MEIIKNQSETKKMQSIFLLKCLAVLLVLNSHLDAIYPVPALATGGALGNTLFFFVSGYTWASGVNKKPFTEWYKGKLSRIYIPTIITNVVYIILFGIDNAKPIADLFRIFVFPNKSWFCGVLLLFSVFYYYIARGNKKAIIGSMITCAIVYFVWYVAVLDYSVYSVESLTRGGLCRYTYYAICMLFGLYFRRFIKVTENRCGVYAVFSFLFVIAFYFDKYLMTKNNLSMKLQFLNQLLTLAAVVAVVCLILGSEQKLSSHSAVIKPISIIADYSWEIYLTQTIIIPKIQGIPFPVNFLIILVLIAVASFMLKQLVGMLLNRRIKDRFNPTN